jgi:zinc/manganese transport system permease protein
MLEIFQLPFMTQALIACLLLSLILSYFGVHVVSRGIVFIDLALAQISSVGVAFAVMTGGDPRLYALLFTLVGAVGLSLIQTNNKRVPQEAVIGIIYAVSSALSILLMAKTPHGDADVTEILFGNILAVNPAQITEMAIVFAVVGLFHAIFHKKFYALSMAQIEANDHDGPKVSPLNPWNMLFYLSLALVISSAVAAAGVLQVFAYLIVPAVCALLFIKRFWVVLSVAVVISVVVSLSGLLVSYSQDLPTGASIVGCFGGIFLITLLLSQVQSFFAPGAAAARQNNSENPN